MSGKTDKVCKKHLTCKRGNKMETIVKIKNHGEFTQEHLETAKALLRKEVFPQYYTNQVFESLEFEDVLLIDASLINRDKIGSSQTIRYNGLNSEYDKLKTDITEIGWRLYERPIFVTRSNGGKFDLLDGRTKDKILNEKKYKNRICVVVSISDSQREKLGNRLNAVEDKSPAGEITTEDIISLAHRQIESGYMELDIDDIKKLISDVCGNGKFSAQKRSDLAFQIFHQENAIQNSNLLPYSWANNKEVDSWLVKNKYIETHNVTYLPYAASASMKAVFAAATRSREKPGKEVRVVIYVSKLNGFDLKKCYLDAVLKFKKEWYEYMDMLSHTYYSGANPCDNKVVLYGCVPSQIEDVCEDFEKLIIFGKNDQNIREDFLLNKNLSAFFDMEEDEENE